MRAGQKSWSCGLLLGALALPLVAGADGAAVGQVTSIAGQASAQREGGASRPLACGDPVYAGESVVTGPGSSAGLLLGADLLAQVGEASSLRLGTTPAGTPDATLQRGAVRVIDARAGAAPARLAAGTASARVAGGDSEAYLLAEKAGGYAMFCEWDAPLAVQRGGESRTAGPSQCVIAKPDEPLYVADAHQDRLPAGPDSCPPGGIASLGPHFPVTAAQDVAAGPPAAFSQSPAELPGLIREPCETPGASCPVILLDESPPGGGGSPGGGGDFPGGGQGG
jgi:hypothetical protein